MDNESIINELQECLDNSTVDHNANIMKQDTLKNAHIYCKVNKLSRQVSGPLIENYIKVKYNMKKNMASSCTGDLLQWGTTNMEVKISNGGKDCNRFNYVQIRMNHNCDYLFTAYYLCTSNLIKLGELFIFKISKEELKILILKHGSYAHGTKKKLGPITLDDLNDTENSKEYSLRPKFNDSLWKLLQNYRVDDVKTY